MHLARFWAELRRRRVVRVAIAYSAVAWLLIEVASTIVPELGLPASITRVVILSAIAGFPLALVLAWALDITPTGIEVTDADQDSEGAQPLRKKPAAGRPRVVFLSFIAGTLLAAGLLSLYQFSQTKSQEVELARMHVVEISRLTDNKRYAEAYAIAVEVENTLQDDEVLGQLLSEISDQLTVITDPPGATVTARMIPKQDASRLGEATEFGITPLENLRIARSDWLLRIEQADYAVVERIASSALNRSEFDKSPEIRMEIQLIQVHQAPPEMVLVPGGEYQMVSPDLPRGLTAILDDFFIDKYEVSNADFAEFVRSGGYSNSSLWPPEFVAITEAAEFDTRVAGLVDQSGRNGPRGWSGQAPAINMERHPVTGVSWFEAYAYCSSQGKRLPSVYQWEKAARDGLITRYEGVVMPWGYVTPGDPKGGRVNFGSEGTLPVDAQPAGISPFGAYAMAGNVKEWTANTSGEGRIVTGGSWEDPDYLFSEFGLHPPMSSASSLGFRCALVRANDARRNRDQGSLSVDLDESTPVYEPVSEDRFRSLLGFYRYDPRPARAEIIETVESPDWIREKISYVGPQNERVLAYLWLPKSVAPPYQTILSVPGVEVFYGESVFAASERYMGPHVRSGRALFAPVLKGMVEREWGPDFELPATDSIRFRDLMVRHATELRLGLDYLVTRKDIDADRIVYSGISLGAGSRLGWAAVDDRFSAIVFIGGGIDERMKPTLPEADNVNFAPYIRPPKLMVNGWQDDEHPWKTRGLPLWNLLNEPKQKVLFDGAGHIPPETMRVPAIEKFLDDILGSPQ